MSITRSATPPMFYSGTAATVLRQTFNTWNVVHLLIEETKKKITGKKI